MSELQAEANDATPCEGLIIEPTSSVDGRDHNQTCEGRGGVDGIATSRRDASKQLAFHW